MNEELNDIKENMYGGRGVGHEGCWWNEIWEIENPEKNLKIPTLYLTEVWPQDHSYGNHKSANLTDGKNKIVHPVYIHFSFFQDSGSNSGSIPYMVIVTPVNKQAPSITPQKIEVSIPEGYSGIITLPKTVTVEDEDSVSICFYLVCTQWKKAQPIQSENLK